MSVSFSHVTDKHLGEVLKLTHDAHPDGWAAVARKAAKIFGAELAEGVKPGLYFYLGEYVSVDSDGNWWAIRKDFSGMTMRTPEDENLLVPAVVAPQTVITYENRHDLLKFAPGSIWRAADGTGIQRGDRDHFYTETAGVTALALSEGRFPMTLLWEPSS